MLMTHGSMGSNNVYSCTKYLLPVQHLDVKLYKLAINNICNILDKQYVNYAL